MCPARSHAGHGVYRVSLALGSESLLRHDSGNQHLERSSMGGKCAKETAAGGAEMGTLTLSRFFVLHVFLIPAFIFVFVAMHVYSFRKAGAAGPVTEDPVSPKLPTKPFYPKQLVMDMGFAMLIIVALGVLAYAWPAELGPKADPSDTQFLPRPEWYYIPVFQYLKYWHGSTAVLGILVIPGILGLLLVGLPFFDRSLERRPWKRPISVGLFTIIFLGLGGLGFASHREDMRNPGVAAQLKTQHEGTIQFMKAKFEPELSGGSLVARSEERRVGKECRSGWCGEH